MKTMKYNLYNMLIATSLLLMTACSADQAFGDMKTSASQPLRIAVSAIDFQNDGDVETRMSDNASDVTFEAGDKIGVIVLDDAGGLLCNNIPYQYTESQEWKLVDGSPKAPLVEENLKANCTYITYHPYSDEVDGVNSLAALKAKLAPKGNQSVEADYRKSDLMVCSQKIAEVPASLAVRLKHVYGSIVFTKDLFKSIYLSCNGKVSTPFKAEDGTYRFILSPSEEEVTLRASFVKTDNTTATNELKLEKVVANTRYIVNSVVI